jgi:hypothetical protein
MQVAPWLWVQIQQRQQQQQLRRPLAMSQCLHMRRPLLAVLLLVLVVLVDPLWAPISGFVGSRVLQHHHQQQQQQQQLMAQWQLWQRGVSAHTWMMSPLVAAGAAG